MAGTGMLYTITGPSGVGKTRLVESLCTQEPGVQASVSHTTRGALANEAHGRDYFFVDDAEFDRLVAENAFLEHAEVFGHRYGTSAAWVREQLDAGSDVVLEIDWVGARAVRRMPLPSISVFILPPSLDALLERLRRRRRESAKQIARRMQSALADSHRYQESDYLIVNADFEQSVQALRHIVVAGRLRRDVQERRHAVLCKTLSQDGGAH